MASIWGRDCLKWWILEKGQTNLVPPHKFLAFSSRPRASPRKDLAFIGMKVVATTILHTYYVQVVETSNVTLASYFKKLKVKGKYWC